MSIVWWNPDTKSLVADTISIDDGLRITETKLYKMGKWNVGVTGSEAIVDYLRFTLPTIDNAFDLYGQSVPRGLESRVLLYHRGHNSLNELYVDDDGSLTTTTRPITKFLAIGWGNVAAMVVNSLGYDDAEIAQAILPFVHNIAAPFEIMDSKGRKKILWES